MENQNQQNQNQQKVQTLEDLLKKNGIDTNKNESIPQQQKTQNEQPVQVQQPQQQPMVQATIYPPNNQPNEQNQFYKPTVLMSSEDINNLDINKFLGDVNGGGIKLEEDFYLVECIGIELIEDKDFNTGVKVHKYRFSLKVLSNSAGTPIDNIVLHKKTTLSFGDKSNNYAIYKAFMGQAPQGKYNILECKGKRCMIRVENKPSSTGGNFSVITIFAPAPKR